MSRNYPMFGLRMPPDLKERIEREAAINGRSLNLEIVDRLKKSFEPQMKVSNVHSIAQTESRYVPEISDIERQLLTIFRRLPPEKQLALLSLFN